MALKVIHRIAPYAYLTPCAVVIVSLAGCGGEDIEQYRVRRMSEPQSAVAPQSPSPQRLLAAIVPQPERSWFFKLLGPPEEVAEQKAAFDAFIRSVRLQPGAEPPITWQAPEGWHEHAGDGFREATFHIGSHDTEPLELTVSRAGGSVLDNVNRWRGQIGLGPVTQAELDNTTTKVAIGDATAVLVDETGVGTGATMGGPFASGARPDSAPSRRTSDRPTLSDTPPDGWEPSSGSSISILAYRVGEGDGQAEVTVTVLGGPAGGVDANIRRWRGQVGLDPNDDTAGERREIELDGDSAVYVDLPGPAEAGAARQRMLGVIAERDGQSWFFKMTGAYDLVEAQKPKFEQWIESVRFDANSGGG